jgi:hypothetical protein
MQVLPPFTNRWQAGKAASDVDDGGEESDVDDEDDGWGTLLREMPAGDGGDAGSDALNFNAGDVLAKLLGL